MSCASAGADRVSELPDTVDFLEQLRGLHAAETSQDQGELGLGSSTSLCCVSRRLQAQSCVVAAGSHNGNCCGLVWKEGSTASQSKCRRDAADVY